MRLVECWTPCIKPGTTLTGCIDGKASTVEVEVGRSEVQSPSAVQQVCRQLELQETLSHETKPQAKEKKILKKSTYC